MIEDLPLGYKYDGPAGATRLEVTLSSGEKIWMWTFAIDVRNGDFEDFAKRGLQKGDYDVMREDTPASLMGNNRKRLAGHNKFDEKEASWRDVWIVEKFEKTELQSGTWQLHMSNAIQPAGLTDHVLSQRYAKHPENEKIRKQWTEETCSAQCVPRSFLKSREGNQRYSAPAMIGHAEAKQKDEIAQNWEEHKEPLTGKTFYQNKVTKETTWEKPTRGWEEHKDPSIGKTVFHNGDYVRS
eukprot:Skav213020  [mRNA]  locus=scaffold2312:234000:237612:+ [translate_table: standard]